MAVPQRVVGPAAFPLDRVLAILGSFMEEHDQNVPKLGATHSGDDDDDYRMEKDTEMAVGRIGFSDSMSFLSITTHARDSLTHSIQRWTKLVTHKRI